MRSVSEIRPFEEILEIYHLPAFRIIGVEARSGGKLGNTAPALWDSVFKSGKDQTLRSLPSLIPESLMGWTCEHDPETDTFVYMVCTITPAGTEVPEGFTFRDWPETLCAKGLFGEDVGQTCERIRPLGYTINWDICPWNAELYMDEEEANPPKQSETPWHWLVPVKPGTKERI